MTRSRMRLAAGGAAALLALGLAGCSVGDTPEAVAPTANETSDGSGSVNDGSDNGSEGNDDRAFGASDDAVVMALLAAINGAERAEWQGATIYIHFPEGSVSDPTAGIGCLGAETVIAEDENAVMVYPDGELDCSTR